MDKVIKYIDNDKTKGVAYDWRYLVNETNKLIDRVCNAHSIDPNGVYHIQAPLDSSIYWYSENSSRSVGKTTSYLLLGIVAYCHYGMKIEYVRTTRDAVAPSNARELFTTILDNNYINEITGGRWSNVQYKNKEWYLCNLNEKGEIEEIDINPFCHMHNLQYGVESTKSTYNSPQGDLILYDECVPVTGITSESYWLLLCQLLSTITRQRLSCRFILLANTINPHTHLFHELGIAEELLTMKEGTNKIVNGLVPVWVNLIKFSDTKVSEKRKIINLAKFGFRNPKLKSITGGGWEIKNYPHFPRIDCKIIGDRVLFDYFGHYLVGEFRSSEIGYTLFIYDGTIDDYKHNRIVYTLNPPCNKWERYGFSRGDNVDRLIKKMMLENKVHFAYNDTGSKFYAFLNELKDGVK